MTREKSMLQDLTLIKGGTIAFGGKQKGQIIGHNTVGNGTSPSIKDVLFVKAFEKGKQTKNSFTPKNLLSTSKPLELLHMDLFGQRKTTLVSGKITLASLIRAHKSVPSLDTLKDPKLIECSIGKLKW
uniref:Uncharacterized protein LOC101515710 n=1 Tax=Cicer arietinum TaxID=3827 RepID=A0A1S3EGV9_CICAR|nr:uncharacterized protein LOC101515710 [Cicer arietinum]